MDFQFKPVKNDHTVFLIFRSGLLKKHILSEQSKVFSEIYMILLHDDILRLLAKDGIFFKRVVKFCQTSLEREHFL